MSPDEVLLGVAVPSGWCAPAEVTCICGSTDWPHECTLVVVESPLDLPELVVDRG